MVQVQTERLLWTLEQLLQTDDGTIADVLGQAALPLAVALGADKVDAFLVDTAMPELRSIGTGDTPMGQRQIRLGLHHLQLSNAGRAETSWRKASPLQASGMVEQEKRFTFGRGWHPGAPPRAGALR